MKTAEQQAAHARASGLSARQFRVMGSFLIGLAVIVGIVIIVDFWKRLGSAAPLLAIACVMDVVAGGVLFYLGHKKARMERNG